ncbi:MAG: dnaE [Burkholderiaceae bacterium]|nr:dnaE [Burkholderiaceae bacterium]
MAEFNLESLPLNDRPTYDLLTKAKTVAVFQLESRGMQGMLKDAKPDRFEDIIALVALYRPGPMDLIPDFCKRKHGERFDYPDPRTEGILSETYGIMVYQEQVMQMAQVVGGYSLGGADLLRRAMGKKKPEEMAEHRLIFREGAAKNGLLAEKADEIFDLMEKFAGYGFNKSHAAAYALLAYQTAYLKAHHPAAFIAANMSLAMDDTDKIKVLVEDALEICKLTLLPPDINQSDYRFTPVGEPPSVSKKPVTQIRYGLGAVRGAGQNAIEAIVEERKKRPFTDLFDFCQRIDRRLANRRTIEALIRAGAFDCFGVDRAVLLASVSLAMEAAEQAEAAANQNSLFGGEDSDLVAPPEYVKVPPWSEKQKLIEEKAALGLYLSGHMFNAYASEARHFARTRLAVLEPSREPKWIAGIIAGMRPQMTQRGRIVIVTLDDGSATLDVTVFGELYESYRSLFKEDEFLAVQGKVSEDRFTGGMRVTADNVLDIAGVRMRLGKALQMVLPAKSTPASIADVLSAHRSEEGLPVVVQCALSGCECALRFGDDWRVAPTDALKQVLVEKLGATDVRVEYGA